MWFICVAGSLSTLLLCAGLVPTWTRNTVNTAIQTLSVFIVVDSSCDLFIALTSHYSSRNLPYPVHNTELVNGYHRSNGWRGVEGDLVHAFISVRSIHRDLPLDVKRCDSLGVALRNQINHGCRVRDGLGVGDRYG